jgi:hypothetical protein
MLQAASVAAVLAVLFQPRLTGAQECGLSLANIEVTWRNCPPQSITVLTCRGRCNSYVTVDPNQPSQLMRQCRCCSHVEMSRDARIRLRCPSLQHPNRVVIRAVRIALPLSCACRPCTDVDV